ncbi:cAMP-dependent protein kinase type II regulatory subunit-like [Tropilaelaps mercedesae]|uniref:cAMP-dependent protein kinase type II regulatory subunit-like n=1 Tax=Tropilaelaps mercedesae TaxID=418985 RepID=A0A1V9X0D3_9ACAR|nr:cAMP-dependent protein kinase type II regulatory subunit-like [Tropilaelaps mercedesae]
MRVPQCSGGTNDFLGNASGVTPCASAAGLLYRSADVRDGTRRRHHLGGVGASTGMSTATFGRFGGTTPFGPQSRPPSGGEGLAGALPYAEVACQTKSHCRGRTLDGQRERRRLLPEEAVAFAYLAFTVNRVSYVFRGTECLFQIVHPKSDEQRELLALAVKNILLFRSLDASQMQEVLDAMFERKVGPNEIVIQQGDDGDNFYVIQSGVYNIFVKNSGTGENLNVGKYDSQGSFGELALLYNQPRAATIQAMTEGSLWAMVSCCRPDSFCDAVAR